MTVDTLQISSLRSMDIGATKLVRLVTGEYTAFSVIAHFQDASKLDLVKVKDGNYVRPPIIPSPAYALLQSASGVQIAVTTLPLGGR